VAGVGLGFAAYRWFFLTHNTPALTEKGTIVVADFANMTGDPVFDGTLRQGLTVQLEQSPFLSLVPDQRIQEVLQLMEQPADAKLTPEISRGLCQRIESKVLIQGSIAQIGTQYSLILRAENCVSGEVLASTESRASDKSHVLDALGKATSELRVKLGESLSTLQKFDLPLDRATTASLEALQAYSFGRRAPNMEAAVSSLQRAIRLDPNFAMAYASLGVAYCYHGESTRGVENLRKAYDLREHVSEREKFYIESSYYEMGLGDTEKSGAVYELWAQLYPEDVLPRARLADIYILGGKYEKALEQWRVVLLHVQSGRIYSNIVENLLDLNRITEAQATIKEAQAKNLDDSELHNHAYTIAFLQSDEAGMAEQARWFEGKPEEEWMLAREANVAAYSGRLKKAREFSRLAAAVAERQGRNGWAAAHAGEATLREALFGNVTEARQRATKLLARSAEIDTEYLAGLALGAVRDTTRTQALADDLAERFPENTALKFYQIPTLRAQVALNHNDPVKAIELLEALKPYDLGYGGLYPAYLRGQAYLAARQGAEAAAQFQKIIDHRGLVNNMPIGALSRLQIGRAYAIQGDMAKAKAAYQDFLTLWKDADPDIPIYVAAHAEYAKLQ
jgi:hypothetical protein